MTLLQRAEKVAAATWRTFLTTNSDDAFTAHLEATRLVDTLRPKLPAHPAHPARLLTVVPDPGDHCPPHGIARPEVSA